jgi:hypothetical protein
MGDASQPAATPPSPTVSTGGTKRDFGNMLNYHQPKKTKAHHGDFSPWLKIKKQTTKLEKL